jgi:ABC-type xylose transport system substrate-binding protein
MDMAIAILDGKSVNAPVTYNNKKIDVKSQQTKIDVVKKDNLKTIIIDSGYKTQANIDSAS